MTDQSQRESSELPPCETCGGELTDERIEELRVSYVMSRIPDTVAALAELQAWRARASSKCPMCGKCGPHTHDVKAREATVRRLVEKFRRSPSQSEAWAAVDRLAALALEER
jgi:hypothetical protein